MQMFKQLEEFGWECGTEALNVVVRCLCLRGHVAAANSLVNKVRRKISFDGETYNVVIGGWSKVGRVGEIERILKEMVADGFDPDGSTFSFLIEGLGRAGRIGDAVEIFGKKEKETGCAPDTVVYNAMISNFISVGDLDESSYGPPHAALMIYKKARAVGCRISLSAYKLLLMRLSTFGKSGMLLNIWDEMQGSAYCSDVEVYEHVINGLCNNGQLENAILLMEECMSKGFCPRQAYKLFLKIKAARLADNARKYWHF